MNRRTRGLVFQLGSFEQLRRVESHQHTTEALVGSSRLFPGGFRFSRNRACPKGIRNFNPPPAAHADQYHEFEVEGDRPGGMARTNTGDHPPR